MTARAGTDESGKGDYFGPLVVAAVYIEGAEEDVLAKAGVKDSKKLTDAGTLELGRVIRKTCKYDVVRINPERYNQLYQKFGNLNKLLAWGHARAIENLLGQVGCKTVISDKFGDEKYLLDRLMKKGRKVQLIQRTKAESDMAVAAASVIAREAFLLELESMSKRYGIRFPKGATVVEHAGRMFVNAYGADRLSEVAKLHFKTTKRIIGKPSADKA